MKIVTLAEAVDWSRGMGFDVIDDELSFDHKWTREVARLEIDSLSIFYQSKKVIEEMGASPYLLLIFEWGIFENLPVSHWVFSRIRASYGETRSFRESPGIIFDESPDAIAMTAMIISFGWDAYLASSLGKKVCILRGHEGWMEVLTRR